MSLTKYATPNDGKIVRKLVDDALAAGLVVSVNDGEEWTVKKSRERAEILGALATTGEDHLRFRREDGSNVGTVSLIYDNGNEGCDVISDHTANEATEALVKGASDLAAKLEKKGR
jgi:hypothetical protein